MTDQQSEKSLGSNLDHGWQGAFGDARLDAPTFHRNHAHILTVMNTHMPPGQSGHALEIGSGSGQHVIGFAEAYPNLTWHPSDPDTRNRTSIDAWRNATAAKSVTKALDIDVSTTDWALPSHAQLQVIVCINVLHIAPWSVTEGLLAGAGRHLAANTPLFIYGPFMRDGAHTAESNAQFDMSLQTRNPEWGIRDIGDIESLADTNALDLIEVAPMPANNCTLVFKRRA